MMDAFSRKILAHYISFNPPSFRSTMMLFRDCVRRHGRLPFSVVVDGGPDFNSVYFETLLSVFTIWKFERPGKMPRAGSPEERFFGTNNTQFIYNLEGNTQTTKEPRTITKENDPELHAIWFLKALDEKTNEFFYQEYNNRPHPALFTMSPNEKFQSSTIFHGKRKHLYIPFDLTFYMLTLPGPDSRGTTRLLHGDGIQVRNDYYDCAEFKKAPHLLGKPLEVRIDPDDYSLAYAYLENRWVQAYSSEYAAFKGRSEKEVELISHEMEKLNSNFKPSSPAYTKSLAQFLLSIEATEEILRQRLKDIENRMVNSSINGNFSLQQFGFREERVDNSSLLNLPKQESRPSSQILTSSAIPERTAHFGDY